jgi:two-component system phosphate regulon sensor histidine kinase PhoR
LPLVEADAQRVGQTLLNLVSNAIKFSGEGGVIRVRAMVDGDHLRCEVQDQGPGIAEEDVPRLFQRFTQLDMGTTRAVGGVGLGLSICKALIEAHGGQIGVTSEPGEGSTFWFTLPLSQPASRSAKAGPSIEALRG